MPQLPRLRHKDRGVGLACCLPPLPSPLLGFPGITSPSNSLHGSPCLTCFWGPTNNPSLVRTSAPVFSGSYLQAPVLMCQLHLPECIRHSYRASFMALVPPIEVCFACSAWLKREAVSILIL